METELDLSSVKICVLPKKNMFDAYKMQMPIDTDNFNRYIATSVVEPAPMSSGLLREIGGTESFKLSKEQMNAFELFKKGENLFITGPGGTGKTKLISVFNDYAISRGKNIQICALTGCAALLLKCGARTIHSWSGIRLAKGESDKIVNSTMKNYRAISNWKKTDILIIDEVSMMSMKIFDILEDIARISRKKFDKKFGGMQIVLLGDFFQLPPVGDPFSPETESFCFESKKWEHVFPLKNHIELVTIFRQKDPVYVSILQDIRRGVVTEEAIHVLKQHVGRVRTDDCVSTKIFAINNRADFINNQMYKKIIDDEYSFECDVVLNCSTYLESGDAFSTEVKKKCNSSTELEKQKEVDSILNSLPCPKILSLKVGCIVMCRCNLDMENGICNGSQGKIIQFIEVSGNTYPQVLFENGIIKTIEYQFWQSDELPCVAVFQIPLILAWAQTIHKLQGASLASAEIDIGNTVFEYGQVYVALSRVRSLDGLYLIGFEPSKIKANPKVIDFYEKIKTI